MKKISNKIFSYLGMFNIGAYVSSQFVFNNPVEIYRWVLTIMFFIFFTFLNDDKN